MGEYPIVNPALEELGFKSTLKYGSKSKLRKICSRFLRLSYLIDFMSIEALANIYLMSIKDTIDTLRELSTMPCNYEFVNNSNNIGEEAVGN